MGFSACSGSHEHALSRRSHLPASRCQYTAFLSRQHLAFRRPNKPAGSQLDKKGPLQPPHRAQKLVSVSAVATETAAEARVQPKAVLPAKAAELPGELKNTVAVLEADNPSVEGGKTRVYVLGISHVSQASCDQIRQLVALTRPDIVLLELCKDRLGLLVDQEQLRKRSNTWHAARVTVSGVPVGREPWPTQEALLARCRTRPGREVGQADIMQHDCDALLATGLFRTVKPSLDPPGPWAAPMFAVDGPGSPPRLVQPLGTVRFQVTPRTLPHITSFRVRCEAPAEELQTDAASTAFSGIEEGILSAACANSATAVELCLRARILLLEAASGLLPPNEPSAVAPLEVLFVGVESGKVEAVLREPGAGGEPLLTGLEGSAVGGRGWGIVSGPRASAAPTAQLGTSSSLDLSAMAPSSSRPDGTNQYGDPTSRIGAGAAATGSGREFEKSRTAWRPWSEEELRAGELKPPAPPGGPGAIMTDLLMRPYAKLQEKAGRTVGLGLGAAWQAALAAAAENGASQVLLGDRPITSTGIQLGTSIWDASSGRLGGSAGFLIALAAVAATNTSPGGPLPLLGAAAAVLAVAAWPLAAPLLEIAAFASKSASEIEDTVRLKEPLQGSRAELKLWGEDALISWPGAQQPLIAERDRYMARALRAAATGKPAVPAFVADDAGGATVLRYMMPEGGAPQACPIGHGDGAYAPIQVPQAVVAVVGTAHVRGMIQEWEGGGSETDLASLC